MFLLLMTFVKSVNECGALNQENEELNEIYAKLVVVLQCLSDDILPW